jgi:CRISPR-associated protein Cmr2
VPEWIVAFSIGPVGGFIGGGRRSRDLWWGSTWVSECTLAVARTLPLEGLIVPSKQRVEKLLAAKSVAEDGTDPASNWRYGGRISNHILACVEAEDGDELASLIRSCEQKAHHSLAGLLRESRKSVESRGHKLSQAIQLVLDENCFEQQVKAIESGEFIEIYAAWTPRVADLSASIDRVREILDARKSARFFEPPTSRPGRRKSDLDAGRDTVLHPSRELDSAEGVRMAASRHLARKRLGIGTDEELDAIGLARRIAVFQRDNGTEPDLGRLPFPPITRTAADSWLRRVAADPETRPALDAIKKILWEAKRDEIFFTWCSPALDPEVAWEERGKKPECFPFDASFLMEDGLEALEREVRRVGRRLHGEDGVEETLRFLDRLAPWVRQIQKAHGVPPPYFALLFMDGDGVGRALADVPDDGTLRELIEQLDHHSDTVEPRLRKDFLGRAFYIGGDDLAIYLPVDKALEAAVALAGRFSDREWPGGKPLTLSAGVVLGHAKADLRALRRIAQDALTEAKKRRAGAPAEKAGEGWMQIVELPRSGSLRSCAGPLQELAARMKLWQDLLAKGALSLRSPHLLLGLQGRFADPRASDGGDLGIELARHRIRAQISRSSKEENPQLESYLETVKTWQDAEALAHELAISARFHRIGRLRPVQAEEATS